MSEKLDYWSMLFQISMVTKFSDEYLLSLSRDEVEKLYSERVEQHGRQSK